MLIGQSSEKTTLLSVPIIPKLLSPGSGRVIWLAGKMLVSCSSTPQDFSNALSRFDDKRVPPHKQQDDPRNLKTSGETGGIPATLRAH